MLHKARYGNPARRRSILIVCCTTQNIVTAKPRWPLPVQAPLWACNTQFAVGGERVAASPSSLDGTTISSTLLSDRYSAQQGPGLAQQTCLAHLARDVAYALEASDDPVPFRLKLWLGSAFDLANAAADLAAYTLTAKRRALERRLDAILAAPSRCELTRALQAKLRRARDQLLTFVDWPDQVGVTNNACERALRPAVIQRKVTNGYRAMWAAQGEADVRTVVDTARLAPNTSVFGTILTTVNQLAIFDCAEIGPLARCSWTEVQRNSG